MKTQIAKIISGDLENKTMTFNILQEEMIVKSGKYAIVPLDKYKKLVNGKTKETEKALDINDVSNSLPTLDEVYDVLTELHRRSYYRLTFFDRRKNHLPSWLFRLVEDTLKKRQ